MRPTEIFIFDIETIPDAAAARRLLKQPDLNDDEARQALREYFLDKTDGRNDFPRQPFHQVVAISYAQLSREPGEQGDELVIRRIATGGSSESSERELLEGFFTMITQRTPQLVSFNGRGFDIPVLKYRAMAHGLSCPRWFNAGDRYNNYDARYSQQYHLDLLELFSDFGASARCSLHEIASLFAIPGKLETSGGDVLELFLTNRVDEIRNYCETDVCSTMLLLLRALHFQGKLSDGALNRSEDGLVNYLTSEGESRPHLLHFLHSWQQTSSS
ncbi:MAG: 3'-5' exonuclease [Mariprofundales bacterium]|nr:3'-5' exonuclease [Mariprofundales bacterium]